jgi:ribosomal protein S4
MPYPSYLLNPGDMFQVEVDRVLYATGAPKTESQIKSGRKLRKAHLRTRVLVAPPKRRSRAVVSVPSTQAAGAKSVAKTQVDIEEVRKQRRLDMKEILTQVDDLMADKRRRVGAKRKIAVRALVRDVRKAMSTVSRKSAKELDDQLSQLLSQLTIAKKGGAVESAAAKGEAEAKEKAAPATPSPEEQKALRKAITRARENPIDDSKPYATPWEPRPYMSAFAFIPRYLEVNHNICSAVYLRHPVAKKGESEVPSPYGTSTHQLAFNWYVRNGR